MLNTIETERLILRPLEESDIDRLYLLDQNKDVMKYLGVPIADSIEETLHTIKYIRQQYIDFGIGRYAVVEKISNQLIGWSGLKFNDATINQKTNFYELGYRFLPETWGKGYATEAAIAFIKAFFVVMKKENLYAYAHADNIGSNHVLKKLFFIETSRFDEHDTPCIWYEMSKKNFELNYAHN